MLDKELEEVKLNVGEDVLDDDINKCDDVDMANALNMNYERDDIDDELDEE